MNMLKKCFPFLQENKCPEIQDEGRVSALEDQVPQKLLVDRDGALRRFACREDLYERALQGTASEYADIARRLTVLINDNNIEELRFVVHTFRGVMGNIGVEEIFSLCTLIEERIGVCDIAEIVPLVHELEALMEAFLRYVREYNLGS